MITDNLEERVPMYAIVRTGGKQYQVTAGDTLRVEKLPGDVGDIVELDDVLLVADGDKVTVGQPVVDGARVRAKIVEQGRSKKVLVFKKKKRKGYQVKKGHRQYYTALTIEEIAA
jgi:large subunit ribosomal protein L21